MTELSEERRGEIDALVNSVNADGLASLVANSVNDVSRNDATKAMLCYIAARISESSTSRGIGFAVAIANSIDSVQGLHGVTFALDYCQLEMEAAASCERLGGFKEALALDGRLLRAPTLETSQLTPQQRLALSQRAMQCAMKIDDQPLGDLAAKFGTPAVRQLSKDVSLPCEELKSYLRVLTLSLVSRGRFLEAARAGYQTHLLTHDRRDLERTVCSVILAGAGQARSSLLNLLHAMPEVAELGALFTVLEKACGALLLVEADTAVVVKALDVGTLHAEHVRRGVVEHNMDAVSRFYDNISIDSLCRLLGGLTRAEVVEMVVEMVRSRRLTAKVDEQSGFVFFRVMESRTALSEWDARIGSICNSVSYAGDLIAAYRTDIYAYAQSMRESS